MSVQQSIAVVILALYNGYAVTKVPGYYRSCVIGTDQIGWSSRNWGEQLTPGFYLRIPVVEEIFTINRTEKVNGFEVFVAESDGKMIDIFKVPDFLIDVEKDSFARHMFNIDASVDDGGLLLFDKAGDGRIKKSFVTNVNYFLHQSKKTGASAVHEAVQEALARRGYCLHAPLEIAEPERVARDEIFKSWRLQNS